MLELLGKGKVIGVDIDLHPENKKKIEKHRLFKRISILNGSSIDKKNFESVNKMCKNKKKIMVILDSNHTYEHVLEELKLYSSIITNGSYLVVLDTIIQDLPNNYFKNRPWDKKNNPKTAINEFLKTNDRFKIDKKIEEKILFTAAPNGYLKCIKKFKTKKLELK